MAEEKKRGRRLRDIQRIKKFRLLDDIFMKEVLRGNLAGVQDIVRTVLKRDDIEVIEVQTQDELSNLVGHGVRLDILAKDANGKFYNIEIQRADKGAEPKRARFNLGAVDWHKLPPGANYDELAETWIIFITESDVLEGGLAVYTIDRVIRETGKSFNDEGHILYVNGAYVGDDEIGKLMADFRETDPQNMNFPSLAERAQYFKNTKGGVESMCRIMEEVREEGIEIGVRETRERMIDALLENISADNLLHDVQFSGLGITQEEIDAARKRLDG